MYITVGVLLCLATVSSCGIADAVAYRAQDTLMVFPAITNDARRALNSEGETCRASANEFDLSQTAFSSSDRDAVLASVERGIKGLRRCSSAAVLENYARYYRFMRAWANSYDHVDLNGDIVALRTDLALHQRSQDTAQSTTASVLLSEVDRFAGRLNNTTPSSESEASVPEKAPGFPCADTTSTLEEIENVSEDNDRESKLNAAEATNARCDERDHRLDNESHIAYLRALHLLSRHKDHWRTEASKADASAHQAIAITDDDELKARIKARRLEIYKLFVSHQ